MPAGYTDPQDYWTGSGYSQMPDTSNEGYRAFDESRAMGVDHGLGTSFESYAPWAGGPTQDLDYGEINPYEGGTAPTGFQQSRFQQGAVGAGAGALGAGGIGAATGSALGMGAGMSGMLGLATAMGPLGWAGMGLGAALGAGAPSFMGKKKKRGSPERRDPSYQGQQFKPEEGFPAYYETAQGVQPGQETNLGDAGFQYQQPEQQGYDYDYTGGVAQPSGALADSSQQSYVGQQEQQYGSFYNQDKGGIYDTFTV